eukprot:CAMPEP_0182463950 /NCGR_PEP_ID=MMETSP1319-20130603/8120_1 /TAXON_ID=172717 /ORGANISM="Bolidomonas pacifica, Strain RCC208" /LENGTH=68 /DNA_ID=CAMNT_0024663549 /DNA_START=323 /DNA_END=528 /DNA_ORIENTATION=+
MTNATRGGVLKVCRDCAREAVRPHVAVDDVGLVLDGLTGARGRAGGEGLGEEGEHLFDPSTLEKRVGR